MNSPSSDGRACRQSITHDGWHFRGCGKLAKFVVVTTEGIRMYRCGIHAKRYKRRLAKGEADVAAVEAL